jgi:hypothetical protein
VLLCRNLWHILREFRGLLPRVRGCEDIVFGIDIYSVEKVEEEEELGTSMRSRNI